MTRPTAGDVARIAAVPDDVVRNLQITQSYHELASALRQRTGAGANWCVFATWASKQAGRTIRREDLRAALRERLHASGAAQREVAAVIDAVRRVHAGAEAESLVNRVLRIIEAQAAFGRAAAAVALGNLRVFEEIALQFALFLDALDGGAEALAAFDDGMRPGEPPDGQGLLRDAFTACRAAIAARDDAARAQLLFRANLLIGLHEQTRLQPQIAAALDAAFDADTVRARLLEELLPGFWLRLRHRIAGLFGRRPPLDDAIDALLAEVQRELRRVITAEAMTLQFPDDVVRLGHDLRSDFAPSLRAVTDPELDALLRRIDPTPDSVRESGATDWADLDERIHLICDLFRCRHDMERLYEPPFTAEQVRLLKDGRRPAGPL